MAFTNLEPTGVNTSANFTFANVTVTGNVSSGNANLGNVAIANYFVGNGALLTGISGTYSNADVANYLPTYTGNVSGNYFIGNGAFLTGLAGTYSNADVANYLPTYTGNITANYITGNGSALSSINGSNVTGQVGNALIAGTVYTNAQPNITSVGTLSNLIVSGTANVGNLLVTNSVLGNLIPNANLTYNLGNENYRWKDLYLSGNSIFIGDVQIATAGNDIDLSGNISSGNANLGNVAIANYFIGDGSQLTFTAGANVTGQVGNALIAGTVYTNAQPNITSVGTLTSTTIAANANITMSGTLSQVSGANLVSANLLTGTLTTQAQPNVTSVGTLITTTIGTNSNIIMSGNVSQISGANLLNANYITGTLTTSEQPNITTVGVLSNVTVNALGSVSGANLVSAIYLTGTLTTALQPQITQVGTLSNLSVTGNITAGNLRTDNLLYANGVAWAFGSTYSNTNVAAYLPTYTGNVNANYFIGNGSTLSNLTAGNIIGQVSNALLAGTVYTNAQPNITSLGTLSNVTVTSNVSAGNILSDNLLYANGVAWSFGGASYSNTNVAAYLPTYTGNITANFVNVNYVYTDNLQYANGVPWNFGTAYSNTNVAAYLPTYTGNVNANYFIGNGSTLTNITGGNVTGQVANALIAGTVYTNAQPNITSLGTLSSLTVTGNISSGNANLGNLTISNYFTGNGSLLTSLTGGNITGQVANSLISGTVYTNSQPNITSVGTLSGLSIVGNIDITGNINATGNLNYSNVNDLVVGDPLIYIGANNTGNLYDLGIVASYNDGTYEHTGIARDASDGVWKLFDSVVAEPTTTIDFANGTYARFKSGAIESTGNVTANYFIGNGSTLTNLAGSNVTGQVGNALISGTVYTNAQPNITSLGTLNALSVTGNISSGNSNLGNLAVANFFSGNGSLLTSLTGGNVTGQVGNALISSTVYTNAQPNITSVGTLSNLTVTSNVSAGNILTNNLLYSNGVAWSFGSSYSNTNVAAYLPTYTGNVSANYFIGNGSTLTSLTGSNVTGQVSNALVAGTVYTNAQPNITSVGTLVSTTLAANSNITMSGSLSQISGSNLINANYVTGTLTTSEQPNITTVGILSNVTVSVLGSVSGANLVSAIYLTGTLTTALQPQITQVGTLSSLSVTGNITAGNLLTDNLRYANGVAWSFGSTYSNTNVAAYLPTYTGNVSANYFIGNGSLLTSLTGGNVTGQVSNALIAGTVYTNAQPNITSVGTLASTTLAANANITLSGTLSQISGANLVSATNLTGTLTTAAQPNITSTGTLSSATVTGLITATGTGIKVSNIQDSSGTITVITGYNSKPGDIGVYGNITAGTSGTGNVIATNLTGTLTTAAQPNITSVGTLASTTLAANANITLSGTLSQISGANLVSATNLTGTLTTAAQPNITSLGTLGSLSVTANVSAGNVLTNNLLYANGVAWSFGSTYSNTNVAAYLPTYTGNVNANYFIGNGATLTNITGGNVTGQVGNALIAGTVYTAAQPNITSVGTLITVTHAVNTNIAMSGSLSQLSGANLVSASFLTGTLTTGAQPNITSVGTLLSTTIAANSNITMSGTLSQISGANLVSASLLSGTLTTAAQPNVTSLGTLITVTHAVNTNIAMSGSLSQLSGANLVSASFLTGTLTTGAQPNITSLGTLSSATFAANGNITLSGTQSTLSGANLVSATNLAGTLTTASQTNITAVGTLGTLSVSGNASVTGWITSQEFTEVVTTITGASGTVTHNLSLGMTFYHSSVAANFTANFTNTATTDARSILVTVIIAQGATPYIPNAVQIDGVSQTIRWFNATVPTGTASRTEYFSFNLLRISSTWVVTGSAVSFG